MKKKENILIWDGDNVQAITEREDDGSGVYVTYNHKEGAMVYTFENDREVYLVIIEVSPEKRGKGVGSVLMADYIEYCAKKGKDAVLRPRPSDTHTEEMLREFYRKMGFVQGEDGRMIIKAQ